jgi:hypothetical protein
LSLQFGKLASSWETRLESGDGQKVRQEAEALLSRSDNTVRESNYNDLHAKVGILGIAARGAVLEGDWQGAVSLLALAAETAKTNHATASGTLLALREQHETKIAEWKELMVPREEHLGLLKSRPGLRSEEIRLYSDIETFLAEHKNAIANSEQSIRDIGGILAQLKTEEETCSRSLEDWNGFLLRERAEIQELGSERRYVTEKLAQLMGDGKMSRFERVSFARRLQRLDPTNAAAKEFLNSLLGIKKVAPPAKKAPAKQPPKKATEVAEPTPPPADAAATGAVGQGEADRADANQTGAAEADATNAEPVKSGAANTEGVKDEPSKTEPANPMPPEAEPPKAESGKST